MTTPKEQDDFRLSRAQAQGWNAGRAYSIEFEPDEAKIAALNPHKADPERARWLLGFRNSLGAVAK